MTNDGQDAIITLEALHDPIAAEMRLLVLRGAGIDADVPGLEHRQMLGVLGAYVPLPLRVRRSDAERARELLDALDDPDTLLEPPTREEPEPMEGEGPYRGGPPAPRYTEERKKRVAAFCAFAIPCTAHLYARETTTAWLLIFSGLASLIVATAWYPPAIAALPAAMVYDFFGSLRACDRFNRGEPLTPGAQLARSPVLAAFVAASVWAAPYISPVLSELDSEHEAEVHFLPDLPYGW